MGRAIRLLLRTPGGGTAADLCTAGQTLHVLADWSLYAGDGRLICTIPWDGREVLLKYRDGDVFVRRTEHDPWRLHYTGLGKARVLAKLPPEDRLGTPYAVGLALPISREAVAILKTLGVKEVAVQSIDPDEEKAEDVIDLAPLAGLPLESLIIDMSGCGRGTKYGSETLCLCRFVPLPLCAYGTNSTAPVTAAPSKSAPRTLKGNGSSMNGAQLPGR